jgi:hypothetical protein
MTATAASSHRQTQLRNARQIIVAGFVRVARATIIAGFAGCRLAASLDSARATGATVGVSVTRGVFFIPGS